MGEAFVIHIHTGRGPDHYDLMLPDGEALATWQLRQDPSQLTVGQAADARRIQPHRRAYLDYEGPISRGRGRVHRLDRGPYERLAADETCWRFRLEGHRLNGRFELRRCGASGGRWTLRRLDEADE